MSRDLSAYLLEIQRAISNVLEFTRGRAFEEYDETPILRAAVERKLTIIGGMLGQISLWYPDEGRSLGPSFRLVEFGSSLVEQYHSVDNRVVWNAVHLLPELQKTVRASLGSGSV